MLLPFFKCDVVLRLGRSYVIRMFHFLFGSLVIDVPSFQLVVLIKQRITGLFQCKHTERTV